MSCRIQTGGDKQRVCRRHQQNDQQRACRNLAYLKNNTCGINRLESNFTQSRWPDDEGPEGKVSLHTGCPVTQAWTLTLLGFEPGPLNALVGISSY
jgi:hypothetical protein